MRPVPTLRMCCQRILAGFAVAVLTSAAARGQAAVEEEVVEAAYLQKFPGFVDWPADVFRTPASPIVIGVAGAPRVLEELAKIARGRRVLGRPVEAKAVSAGDPIRDVHVLFVGAGAAAEAKALLDEARQGHVLTVTDLPAGLKAGAVLDFVRIDGRLRFEASLAAARRAEVKLSSRLLSVASRVVDEAP
jgi:hypothetical protein